MSETPIDERQILKTMLLSRECDRREGILLRQSKGWFQIGSMGHEAMAALALAFRPDDWLFPYYRDRAAMLARGYSVRDMALDFFAKLESGSGGRQMPCHFSARHLNVFSVGTPTASSLLPACGAAWGMKLEGKDTVCQASLGDAASRQGEFYEAVCFAAQEKLPVVFCVMDNKFGISTPTHEFLPTNLGVLGPDFSQRADGRDPQEVYRVASEAVAKARAGDGPSVIWFDLDRLGSHTSSDDHRVYRDPEDIAEMNERDPIRLLADKLVSPEEFKALQDEATAEVFRIYQEAENAQDPAPEDIGTHMWGNDGPATAAPLEPAERTTMVSVVNQTLLEAMAADSKIVLFGEDIEDPKGGVFGLTKGLSTRFPGRVFNSPLAEATIVGVAVGLAAYGMRPVFELQFIDFITPGWNQLTTNVATLRWRTAGHWKCPMLFYAPSGAYLPGGSLWHSQSNEGGLAHIPGLRIAVPSSPEDAAGLFWSAVRGDDPTLILVPKHVFRKPASLPQVRPVPIGSARLVREGNDCTIVAWGNCLELAEEVAQNLADRASIEVLDIRSIVPLDIEAITRSVAKTGRLVVVHEDSLTSGFGQAVVSQMVSDPARWNLFLAPPQIVARPDVPIGFNPILEYAALPGLDDIEAAVLETLR